MSLKVYPGNFPGTICLAGMAASAKFSFHRLLSKRKLRIDWMFLWNDVTFCAGQRNMMGDSLFICNFTVACAAFLRRMRQQRIMRIMTFHTRFAGIMKHRYNLRKPGGAWRIVAMTKRAISALPRCVGCEFIGGLNVLRCGSVTHFAGYIPVVRSFFEFRDIIMAIHARATTGVFYLLRNYLTDRIGPVMAVFSEWFGDKQYASPYKCDDCYCKKYSYTNYLLGYPEPVQKVVSERILIIVKKRFAILPVLSSEVNIYLRVSTQNI